MSIRGAATSFTLGSVGNECTSLPSAVRILFLITTQKLVTSANIHPTNCYKIIFLIIYVSTCVTGIVHLKVHLWQKIYIANKTCKKSVATSMSPCGKTMPLKNCGKIKSEVNMIGRYQQ